MSIMNFQPFFTYSYCWLRYDFIGQNKGNCVLLNVTPFYVINSPTLNIGTVFWLLEFFFWEFSLIYFPVVSSQNFINSKKLYLYTLFALFVTLVTLKYKYTLTLFTVSLFRYFCLSIYNVFSIPIHVNAI